ncbi:MAG: hypothetical protein IPK80_28435 [Nannocystis sp.]|nr:hypothetical protein [Nannocystis sp.]
MDEKHRAPDVERTACLTHGLLPEHFLHAAEAGELQSPSRRGEKSKRAGDQRANGGTAVYTRAIGTEHADVPPHVAGVGSGASKVQVIMSPEILEDEDHQWRASTYDRNGSLPGSVPAGKREQDLSIEEKWGKQTRSARNQEFNKTVETGGAAHLQNEQAHYESIPLKGTVRGVVCTGKDAFDKLMASPRATQTDATHGTIEIDGEQVPVVFVDEAKDDRSLLDVLKDEGIANEAGQVR